MATERAQRDAAIDSFLGSIGAQLRGMAPARREEELRELGQHLDLLVAGYRAQGLSERAAAAAAIDRFGRAEHLARELRAAARRPDRGSSPLYYLAFWLGYGAVIVLVHLAILAVIDAPLDLPERLGDRLRVAAWPAVILPAVFVLHDVWRRRRDRASSA